MARPTPIVVPASHVSSTSQPTDYLSILQGLSLLTNLYQGTIGAENTRQRDITGAKQMTTDLGMTPEQSEPLVNSDAGRKALASLFVDRSKINEKDLAAKQFSLAQNAPTGAERVSAEKSMQSLDRPTWQEYKKETDTSALGQGLGELNRLGKISGQEENKTALADWLTRIDPKLAEPETPHPVLMAKDESGNLVPNPEGKPYNVTKNKLGQTLSVEPIRDPMDVAQTRAEAFGAIPTSTPGIYFDRITRAFMTADGRKLTEAETRVAGLSYKEETPTNDIKVMKQSIPSVLGLTDQVEAAINQSEKNLGPMSSRWRDFASGKVGAADPDFRTLYSTTELLKSRLTKMHFGSKGGEKIVERFDKMIDASKDSPANLRATLEVIRDYANQVANEPINPVKGGKGGGGGTIKGAHGSY